MLTESQQKRKINQSRGSLFQNKLIKKATKQELILKDRLDQLGIKFKFQKVYYTTDTLYILDFYLKTYSGRYNIEIDGEYHLDKKSVNYDKRREDWILNKRKTKTIRFTNKDIENNLINCVDKIMSLNPIFIK